MVTCAPGIALRGRDEALARKRFAAACVVSVLVHVWFAMAITAGPPGRIGGVAPSPVIAARLVTPSAPPLDAPLAELATPPVPVRQPPREQRAQSPSSEPAHTAKIEPNPRSSTGIANTPDATYYAARQLDVYPALASPLDLRYSPAAAATGIRGHALLLLLIDAHGIVDEVSIAETEPGGYFEEDARRAFLAARFTPALKNGRAVKSRILIRITYGGEPAAQ